MLPSPQDHHFLIIGGTGSFGWTMVARGFAAGAVDADTYPEPVA